MKVLIVTGDRHATEQKWRHVVNDALIGECFTTEPAIILHGAATGIDTLAAEVAASYGDVPIPFPAQWDTFGTPAGPIRNEAMLRVACILQTYGHTVKVLAFHDFLPKSKGTKHMVGIARKEGIDVTLFHSDGTQERVP